MATPSLCRSILLYLYYYPVQTRLKQRSLCNHPILHVYFFLTARQSFVLSTVCYPCLLVGGRSVDSPERDQKTDGADGTKWWITSLFSFNVIMNNVQVLPLFISFSARAGPCWADTDRVLTIVCLADCSLRSTGWGRSYRTCTLIYDRILYQYIII